MVSAIDDVRRSLRNRREALGMTQSGLAERMGTTQSAVCDLELGRAMPRVDTLARWAEALDLRLSVTAVNVWEAAS